MRFALIAALFATAASTAHAATFNTNPGISQAEVAGMQVLYELEISGTNPGFRNGTPVPYLTDNSLAILAGSYSRIGYYVEVTSGTQAGEFVYVSLDAFNANPSTLGLPHNVDNPIKHQQVVNNANIFSNNANIVTGTNVDTVNVEMWSTNYNRFTELAGLGGTDQFDFDDCCAGIGAGHGSFQIHNHGVGAQQTLFGWSDWGGNSVGAPSEFGIGNATLLGEPHPDWTFSDRGQTGFVQIVVGNAIPEPATATLGLLGLAGLLVRRRRAA